MKEYICFLFILFLSLFYLLSCKKDKDDPANPNNPNTAELITTLKLVITEQGNPSNVIEAVFKDEDGDGGALPTQFDTVRLASGKIYNVEILLLDESNYPADTISNEVEEEGDQHQFFFTTSGADVSFSYSDADMNGVPIGLLSAWATGVVTTDKNSKILIVLKHQGMDKPDSGSGNSSVGDTDIEVNFPVIIQ